MTIERTVQTLFSYAFTWAQWLAAFAIDPAETLPYDLATLFILSIPGFMIFYFLFHVPMIIGDGLTRNIPVLGVLFYRVMCFMIILLVSHFVATGITDMLTGHQWLPETVSPAYFRYGTLSALTLVISAVSYKKLENLLSATFYWKRGYGLLDACAFGLSALAAASLF